MSFKTRAKVLMVMAITIAVASVVGGLVSAAIARTVVNSINADAIQACVNVCLFHRYVFIDGECHCKVDNGWARHDAFVLAHGPSCEELQE